MFPVERKGRPMKTTWKWIMLVAAGLVIGLVSALAVGNATAPAIAIAAIVGIVVIVYVVEWPRVAFATRCAAHQNSQSDASDAKGGMVAVSAAPTTGPIPASQSVQDETARVVRENLARIRLISVAGPLLINPNACARVRRLLDNRRAWGLAPPLVMLAAGGEEEVAAAKAFRNSIPSNLVCCEIVPKNGSKQAVGLAMELFRRELDPSADRFAIKRQCVFLTRRGGKGAPEFVSPFMGGQGTTCGAWTPPMVRKPDGSIIKGFMKASVAVGFCPVECPYCYLNTLYTDGMDVALNWEDLAAELSRKWRGFQHPINFGETSGLVEYDEWFAAPGGEGSMIQFIIDACASAQVTPFFLTKIRYPRYLRFHGKVQVGISLIPENVRRWLAPHGSPANELLCGLAWAVEQGAVDPVIRLTVIWQERRLYPELLELCRDLLGQSGWRLTLDILRFTPGTAYTIAKRYPEAAEVFARELDPTGRGSLKTLASAAKAAKEHVKKIRPPADRQAEIYIWFREQLNQLGCGSVMLTPCKGDPEELTPLARQKVINAMPCACFGSNFNKRP